MSKNAILILLIATVFAACNSNENCNSPLFGFKTARVELVTTGKSFGTERTAITSVWIDNYGKQASVEQQSVINFSLYGLNSNETSHVLNIFDGSFIHHIDLIKRIGTSVPADSIGLQDADKRIIPVYLKRYVEQMGGECLGFDSVLGYRCNVYRIWDSKVWVYKGFALKTEKVILGETLTQVATSFFENCYINSNVFSIPPNVAMYNNSLNTNSN